jgi:hypothetical protein
MTGQQWHGRLAAAVVLSRRHFSSMAGMFSFWIERARVDFVRHRATTLIDLSINSSSQSLQ